MTKTAAVSAKQKQDLATKHDPRAPFWTALKAIAPTVGAINPKQFNPDRLNRIFFTSLRQTPKLVNCKVESFIGSVLTASYLGLEPGPLGYCYFIPYGSECQFQLGYKGMIELARRSGQIARIEAKTVRQSDIDDGRFEIIYGSGGKCNLKPNYGEYAADDAPALYYAYIQYKDGSEAYDHMTVGEVKKHRDKYSPSATKQGSPWDKHFEAMAWKTILKRLLKFQSLSPEQQWAQAYDQATIKPNTENQKLLGEGDKPSFENMIDIEHEDLPAAEAETETNDGLGARE